MKFYHQNWRSTKFFASSWALSLELARRHFDSVHLVTDVWGAELLTERLGLRFDEVDLTLEALPPAQAEHWILGKLSAYRRQTAPYVHMDFDVFLWKALPAHLYAADLFVQNADPIQFTLNTAFPPQFLDRFVRGRSGEWSQAWSWYAAQTRPQMLDVGVLGVRDVGLVAEYASEAAWLLEHPTNAPAWQELGVQARLQMILVEQYFLMAFVAWHRHRGRPIHLDSVFDSHAQSFDARCARDLGYTHLYTHAKRELRIEIAVERRLQQAFPAVHQRCVHGWPEVQAHVESAVVGGPW